MKTISVMIVDDEKLAIDDLMSIVDWKENGFEVVATAFNGKQALSKFQKTHPQVVLTDIKMPYMDGIELIQNLRKIDAKTKILLLTAYKDFTYAKSAIQYGVTDYIIKSEINSRTFKETLIKLREAIESEGKTSSILKEKSISDYFNSNEDEGWLPDKEFFNTPHCYLIIERDQPLNISGENSAGNNRHLNADIILFLSALSATEESGLSIAAVSGIQNDQALIAVDIHEVSQAAVRSAVLRYAERIKAELENHFKQSFTIYTVDSKTNIAELKKMYISGRERFLTKYLYGSGGIHSFSNETIKPAYGGIKPEIYTDENLINSLLEKMDDNELESYLDTLFSRAFNSNSYQNLYSVSKELYAILRRHNELMPGYSDKPDISPDSNWQFWLNGKDIKKWFIDKFRNINNEKKRLFEHSYSRVIAKAIDFIHINYKNSYLEINNIADAVHLSTGHLCALFKKETGKTVNNFITEVRIAEAKKLLDESNLKVYEISSTVGYQTSQYFSQVFYKLTGVYPAEYQRGQKPPGPQ